MGIILCHDDGSKVTLHKEQNNGDFNFRLATMLIYSDAWVEDEYHPNNTKYEVRILAVSPEAAKAKVKDALKYMLNEVDMKYIGDDPLVQYRALIDYGLYAVLFVARGNNLRKLLKQAAEQRVCIEGLFGMYMDMPETLFGHTGWDRISGRLGFDVDETPELNQN